MTTTSPGWYPNANDPSEQRYWDGQQWTDRYQRWNGSSWVEGQPGQDAAAPQPSVAPPPAAPSAASPTPAPKKRRLGLILGLVGGGLVIVLVAVFGITALLRGPGGAENVTSSSIVKTDELAGLDYTAPLTGLTDRSMDFRFGTSFRPSETPEWALDEYGAERDGWAFKVFADPSLTIQVPASTIPNYRDGGLSVISRETRYAEPYDIFDEETVVIRSTPVLDNEGKPIEDPVSVGDLSQGAYDPGDWGLYDSYFLVRYIDANGEKLERPVVSPFSFEQELETPVASIVADDSFPGAAKFSWESVPGATNYLVIKSFADGSALEVWDGDLVSRDYIVVAETSETSWSTGSQTVDRVGYETSRYGFSDYQNVALEMFSTNDDEYVGDPEYRPLDHQQVEYGVVAVAADGTTSPFGRASVAAGVATLPHELAGETLLAINQCPGGIPYASECATVDEILTYVPYVTLDGSVHATPAVMLTEPLLVNGQTYTASIIGSGIEIGYWARFQANSLEEFQAAAASFNEKSRQAAPETGVVETLLSDLTAVTEPVAEHSDEALALASGTNELVTFIAAHMIDGHEAVDMSAWSEWGPEAIRDALAEAYWQNPIAGVEAYNVSWSDDLIVLTYEDNRDERMAETSDAIDSIVSDIISDGMSESERVTAINTYLIDNVEYDKAASDAATLYIPDAYSYAWTLSGAILDGTVVCVGYAQAFKALADAADLESVVVTGTVTSSAVGHAWNKVQVDGEWLAVDVTWNDGGDPTEFLMISDSEFVDRAARTYDVDWIYDLYQGRYATP